MRKSIQTTGDVGSNPGRAISMTVWPENQIETEAMEKLRKKYPRNVDYVGESHYTLDGKAKVSPPRYNCRGLNSTDNSWGVPRHAGRTEFGKELARVVGDFD